MNTDPLSKTLLSLMEEGVAQVKGNRLLALNEQFSNLPEKVKHQICQNVSQGINWRLPKHSVVHSKSQEQNLVLVKPITKQSVFKDDAFRGISQRLSGAEDVYLAAAQAICETLGWRWVSINRYVDETKAESLAFLDNKQPQFMPQYDLIGTPCESVLVSQRYTIYSDLLASFPHYTQLHDMGAKSYAGLVCRGEKGRPLGHVMVLHDSQDVDFAQAEDVLHMISLLLTSHFELLEAKTNLAVVENQAWLDGLTGLGNRYAYEQKLEEIRGKIRARALPKQSLMIVDLDRLKLLNDNHGHQKGDEFIQLVANELRSIGREKDTVYRIGGDEFAIILNHESAAFSLAFKRRFQQAIERVSKALQFHVGASIGIATLGEALHEIELWIELADQRMYANKHASKQDSRALA